MGTISILQGKKPTNINNSCLSLMLISSSDFSVPKINHRIAETPKQSTKPVVHGLQSTEELRLINTDVRPGRGGFCSAARSRGCRVGQCSERLRRVPPGQQGSAVHGLAQTGKLGLVSLFPLPAPLPQSSGCSPSVPHPSPAAGSGGGLGGTARWLVWFYTWWDRKSVV